MKILMQSRIDLFSRRGGDTVQIEKTAEELRKLGVLVDIDVSANPDLSAYNLVHIFNIDWPAQTFLQARNAKKQGRPLVFSPIHHSFREIERYEKEASYGLRRLLNFFFRARESRDLFKDLGRMLFDPRKIPSTITELRLGQLHEQQELLRMADVILVQTRLETADIRNDFGFFDQKRFVKVVNGADSVFANASPARFVKKFGLRDFVLSVGRVEPRKNQLKLIEAVAGMQASLVFVGRISWRHPEYALRFLNAVRRHPWICHIPYLPYEEMPSCFAAAKVHVLASWFETTGLVNLEAGLAGTNVVSSSGRAWEYLSDFAEYCDPGDVNSITAAIKKAWERSVDKSFAEYILANFTWEKAAQQTLAVYQRLLSAKES